MNSTYRTVEEVKSLTNQQIFSLENNLAQGRLILDDIGESIPCPIIVQDLKDLKVSYMNEYGCKKLNHSLEEINKMGKSYYDKFFPAEETRIIMKGTLEYCKRDDPNELYSFFQQVRTGAKLEFKWHYTVCKFLRDDRSNENRKIICLSNPVTGMGHMVNKVNKLLDENEYVARNYKKFALLTKREREIVSFLAEGKSTREISDLLFISFHTVNTHRKNIAKKLEINSFVGLLRFAQAFELLK